LILKKFWTGTSSACTPTAASAWPCAQQPLPLAGRAMRQRIQVTGLDAMCRMIDNGLGVGLLPDRAFALMRGVGRLHRRAADRRLGPPRTARGGPRL
jgi:DNA-binding transcriptional LysR family regulator